MRINQVPPEAFDAEITPVPTRMVTDNIRLVEMLVASGWLVLPDGQCLNSVKQTALAKGYALRYVMLRPERWFVTLVKK